MMISVFPVSVQGTIVGNPKTPSFEYVKIGDKVYDKHTKYHAYRYGAIFLNVQEDSLIKNLDPVRVEVKTSLGSLSGYITPRENAPSQLTLTSNGNPVNRRIELNQPFYHFS